MRINSLDELPEHHRLKFIDTKATARNIAKTIVKAVDELAEQQRKPRAESVQIYRLTLPVPPSVNSAYATASNGRRVLSRAVKEYKTHVKQILTGVLTPLTCEVELKIIFYRARKNGDTSNRIKILEDSLTGLAYNDDEQVARLQIERRMDAVNPRVEVEVIPL